MPPKKATTKRKATKGKRPVSKRPTTPAKGKKAGRPSTCTDTKIERVRELARMQPVLGIADIAKKLRISERTFYNWIAEDGPEPAFRDAYRMGRRDIVLETEAGLMGVSIPHDEVTTKHKTGTFVDKDGNEHDIDQTTTTTRHGVVDVRAAIKILETHDPRYKQKVEIDANVAHHCPPERQVAAAAAAEAALTAILDTGAKCGNG